MFDSIDHIRTSIVRSKFIHPLKISLRSIAVDFDPPMLCYMLNCKRNADKLKIDIHFHKVIDNLLFYN